MQYFVKQKNTSLRLLNLEKEKSENLLLNILPKEIVRILKNDIHTIADHYDGGSILFADIVNFTPLSAQLKAVELVELLNEVFSHFDSLVEKYNKDFICESRGVVDVKGKGEMEVWNVLRENV